MKFNAETQTLKLKVPRLAPVSGNSYGAGVYNPGTLPQQLVNKFENDIELVEDPAKEPIKKSGIVEVNNVKTIPVEIVSNIVEEPIKQEVVEYNLPPDPIKTTNTKRAKSML